MSSGERGLVVSPPMVFSGYSLNIKSSVLDAQELRKSLLFWDRMDFPTQDLIRLELGPDAEFLEKVGVLQRTSVRIPSSGDMAQTVLGHHLAAYEKLDRAEPGKWSLATGENSISFPDSKFGDQRGVMFRLHNAIPVPDKDVPLAEILEFKGKRQAELLTLRHHLERIYQKIVAAGDGPLALNTEVEALELAIADHIRTSTEWGFNLRLADLGANLNVLPVIASGFAAFSMGLPLLPSLLAGAAASVSLDVGAALKGREVTETPFRYVTAYHKELFIGP